MLSTVTKREDCLGGGRCSRESVTWEIELDGVQSYGEDDTSTKARTSTDGPRLAAAADRGAIASARRLEAQSQYRAPYGNSTE